MPILVSVFANYTHILLGKNHDKIPQALASLSPLDRDECSANLTPHTSSLTLHPSPLD